MTETKTDEILNGFREWLQREGYALRSADSYCSGIRRINKEFFTPTYHKDMFDELKGAIKQGTAVDLLTTLLGIIGAKAAKTTNPTDKKRHQDNISHLRKFIDYIADAQDQAGLPVTEEYVELQKPDPAVPDSNSSFQTGNNGPDSNSSFLTGNNGPDSNSSSQTGNNGPDSNSSSQTDNNDLYYDHDTLVQIFSRRIRTQDRISKGKNVFFPIRILDRLFSEASRKHKDFYDKGIRHADGKPFNFKRWFADWVRRIVENVVFHTTEGDYRLSEIKGLIIEHSTKRVLIIDKKNERTIPVLSEGPNGMTLMQAKDLNEIHLDHTERMEDILNRLEPVLVIMRKLTDDIKEAVKGQTVTINNKTIELDSFRPSTLTDLCKWYCSQVDWTFIAPLLPHLCTELEYIAAATHLAAMSAAHNMKKH